MANTIKTVMTYPLNGSTVDFNIPFEYLARKFVTITLIGTDRKVLVLNQDYRFSTKTTITLMKAWGPADGYDTIEVRRYTSATDRLVDFADGSILRAYDLNIAQVQTLHVAEEARDLTADTIGVNNEGNLDARGRRIVNVGDAVADYDAINLHMMKTWNTSALNSANAAAASQAAAKTSENNSKTSENNAKTSENNSKTSENNAYQWAQRAEDSPVQSSEFSAYHYSRKSAKSAAAASTSEGNASVSERNAKTSETNAKTSETNSAASAQTAKDEAAKLGNMNDLAAAIDHVDGVNVYWKGLLTAQRVDAGELRATGGIVRVQNTGREVNFTLPENATTLRFNYTSGIRAVDWGFAAHDRLGPLHVGGPNGNVMGSQGAHFVWNESGDGRGSIVVNRGGGTGGFNFRFVNQNNTQETGSVRMSGGGEMTTTGNIWAQGGSVYVGPNGSNRAQIASDGNVWGTRWNPSGEWLFDWLIRNCMLDMGRGGQQYSPGSGNGNGRAFEVSAGCFITGINTNVSDARGMGVYFRMIHGRKLNGGVFNTGDF